MKGALVTRLEDLPVALTVAEFCEVMRASRDTVYDLVRRGELQHIRVGRAIRIPRAVVERLLQEAGG